MIKKENFFNCRGYLFIYWNVWGRTAKSWHKQTKKKTKKKKRKNIKQIILQRT